MINFFIGILRFLYFTVGILFVIVGLLSPVGKADNPDSVSYFDVVAGFLICISFGIAFFWMSNMIGKRKSSIIKYIMILHCIMLFCVAIGIFNLFFSPEDFLSDFKRDPMPPTIWYIFLLFISLFPMWFFTRPNVKKRFERIPGHK